jgi:hypothetical protein
MAGKLLLSSQRLGRGMKMNIAFIALVLPKTRQTAEKRRGILALNHNSAGSHKSVKRKKATK